MKDIDILHFKEILISIRNWIVIVGILIVLAIVNSCSLVPEEYTTTHCYFASGLKLVYGIDDNTWLTIYNQDKNQWPEVGNAADIFNYYNNNIELELYQEAVYSRNNVISYLNSGYRVAITYQLPPNNHVIYITDIGQCDNKVVLWVFVVGYFNDNPL